MGKHLRWISRLILALILVELVSPVPPALAAVDTITVTPGSQDSAFGKDPSACTLREAIYAVNHHISFDGCVADASTKKIVLPAGNYLLTRGGSGEEASYWGDLDISSDVTIIGAGAATTSVSVDPNTAINDRDRIFNVKNGQPERITVTIQGLTISGGYAQDKGGGGAILNEDAEVILRAVIIKSNEAAKGTSGGGILNEGLMTIDNSVIDSNRAAYFGGGIENHGQMTITHSLVVGNIAIAGGGVDNLPKDRSTGYAKMTNVTVAANIGGGINNSGKFYATNLTIARNDGTGLFLNGVDYDANLRNTIVAYHFPYPDCQLQYQETRFTSGGYNLIDNTQNSDPNTYLCPFNNGGVTSDILDQDPLLSESLMKNLGSFTQTYGFTSPQSPAVDAIPVNDPNCPAYDQFYHRRPADGGSGRPIGCDIGAFELNAIPYMLFLPTIRN